MKPPGRLDNQGRDIKWTRDGGSLIFDISRIKHGFICYTGKAPGPDALLGAPRLAGDSMNPWFTRRLSHTQPIGRSFIDISLRSLPRLLKVSSLRCLLELRRGYRTLQRSPLSASITKEMGSLGASSTTAL